MQTGSNTITLAFNLSAVQALQNPKTVLTNAYSWADNIGILTEEPTDEVIDFKQGYNINIDFSSGPRTLSESLKDTYHMIATDRHIYVGTTDEHKELSENQNWEFISIENAADSADWDLNVDLLTAESTVTDQSQAVIPDEKESTTDTIEIHTPTHQWHLVNRGEKTMIVRPKSDTLNENTLQNGDAIILERGLYEQHKIPATVTSITTYTDLNTLTEEIDTDLLYPTLADDETPIDSITQKHGDHDEYVLITFDRNAE